jgi:hypothetical protein
MVVSEQAVVTESLQSEVNADETLAALGVELVPGWKADVAVETAERQFAISLSVFKLCKNEVHWELIPVGMRGFADGVAGATDEEDCAKAAVVSAESIARELNMMGSERKKEGTDWLRA